MTLLTAAVRLGLVGAVALGTSAAVVRAQEVGRDDFEGDSNMAWLADRLIGHGQLARTNGYLEYRVSSPDLVHGDEAHRPWGLTQPNYATDWEVLVDVHNTATPSGVNQVATFGIEVLNANDFRDYAYVEIYASMLYVPSLRRGFKADLALDGVELGENTVLGDTGHQGFNDGSVRMVFDSTTKVLTAWFDRDGSANGYRWEKLAGFGIAGVGGATTNGHWGMTGIDAFYVALYGYSQGMAVASGEINGDNFLLQTVATDRPRLSIQYVPGAVQLRWPGTALGYELETSLAVIPGSWALAPQPPDLRDGTNLVEVPIDSLTRFFRLRK